MESDASDAAMVDSVAEQRSTGEASTSAPAAGTSSAPPGGSADAKPIVVLVIGMAGSGKTTLIQRLNSHLHMTHQAGYIINLDPAVGQLPYGANIDIRDTVNYKNVMKQYGLGPNGGILTSCNLFATRFDQVIGLLEKRRSPPLRYVIVDTPGQIEIFTWSASGQLVTELLASSFPTVVLYVLDTPRAAAPQSFMANMLQAVSILYKTQLPMLLAFNKVDVTRHEFALTWMADFDAYAAALDADASYASSLSRSLSLLLDEFYAGLASVGVSALTGEGTAELFEALAACGAEYEQYYVPELRARAAHKQEVEAKRQAREMEKLRRDMAAKASVSVSGGGGGSSGSGAAAAAAGVQQQQQQPQAGQQGDDEGESVDLQLSDDSIEAEVGRGDDGSE